MCEYQFTCYSQVTFAGYDLIGVQWFVMMAVIAFWLQVSANFIWLRSSQLTREILQRKPYTEERNRFVRWRIFWATMGTLNWILRITLIIGSNIYIFIVILVGNVTGIAWALRHQKEDLPTRNTPETDKWTDEQILKFHKRLQQIKNKKLVL